MNKYYTMSRFLPVPDSRGFDAKEDVEDASATIREFMASIPIAHVPGPDGLKCYQLNPGTKLYRADTERLQYGIPTGIATDYLPNKGPVFFGFAESSVDQYGIVAEYEVLNPILSIALDDTTTLTKLHNDCLAKGRDDISQILRENYGANEPSAVRKSVKPKDFKLINYLIETYGMGGTVFLASVYFEGGSFHPEIALPHLEINSDFLHINGIVTDPGKIPGKIAEYNDRVYVPIKNSDRPTLTLDSSPIPSYNSLFVSPTASPMAYHNTHTPTAHNSPMAFHNTHTPIAHDSPEASHSTPDENMSPNVFNGSLFSSPEASHSTPDENMSHHVFNGSLFASPPSRRTSPLYKTGKNTVTKTSHNSPPTTVIKPKKLSYGGSLRKSSKKTKSKKSKRAKKSQRRRH